MWMCLKAVLYPPSGDLVCAKGEENPVGWWPVVGIPIPFIYRICIPNKNISKSATIFAWMTYVVVFFYIHINIHFGDGSKTINFRGVNILIAIRNWPSWIYHHLPSLNQHPCTIHLPTPLAGISIIYHLPSNLSSYYQHIYICICIYVYMYICIYIYICVNIYVYMYMYMYMYMHTYIYIYMCVYVYVYMYMYMYTYIYICICICMRIRICICISICICLRTETRSRKTHVFEYRDCGVGWGGVGWGGMLTFLVLRTWYIAMLLRSLGLFTTLHVATLLRSLVSFYYVTYMLLRCWDLWDRLLRYIHVATLLRSLVSFTTLHVATLLRSLGSFTTLHVATLLRSLGSFTTLHTCCYAAEISEISESLAMEMHSQECWLPAVYYACVAAMTLKNEKTRPKFFQDFQSSN